MRAGKLRHRFEIQSATRTRDSFGDAVPTWTTIATRWGALESSGGNESWLAQQVSAEVTHKITLRYYAGLTPAHRLVNGSRIFQIDAVFSPDETGREHTIAAKEVL